MVQPVDDDELSSLIERTRREATSSDLPVVDFIINAVLVGIPLVFFVAIFLAALRILGLV